MDNESQKVVIFHDLICKKKNVKPLVDWKTQELFCYLPFSIFSQDTQKY